ncbi:hypothetical protein NKG94_29250 [Micromonospora sp. M12]
MRANWCGRAAPGNWPSRVARTTPATAPPNAATRRCWRPPRAGVGMTGRILRIELRRSAALGIALLSLVVGVALLLSSTQFFAARWMQLAVIVRSLLMVLLPLALAGGRGWAGATRATGSTSCSPAPSGRGGSVSSRPPARSRSR